MDDWLDDLKRFCVKFPSPYRAKMCTNKLAYKTRKAANKQANKFGHRVYDYPYCQQYHISSKPKETI